MRERLEGVLAHTGHGSGIQADLVPLVTALLALIAYLFTVAPDLTWAYDSADGAELITAACTLGIPHPPGYPTYVLLGRVICALPFEPVARNFHLFSATAAAVAAGLVTATARYRVEESAYSSRAALASGLFFAWMLPVWQQAVVAEVYALNLALLAAFLWALLGERPASISGLLLGLSITTHLTSLFMVPLALAMLPRHRWPELAGGICLGLVPFLVLPLLAGSAGPVVWGRPSTPGGWWWLVSARLYRPNLFALPPDRWVARLGEWARLPLPALALATLLLFASRRRRQEPARSPALPAWIFLPSLLLYLVYAFGYDSRDSLVFLLPALLLLSILLARPMHFHPALALFLPLILLLLNFSRLEPGRVPSARALAEPVLQQAPHGAILLTEGDESTFTLWYLQSVEHERPDLTIVDRHLLGFAWYRERLQEQDASLVALSRYDLAEFRRANKRPICEVKLADASGNHLANALSCDPIPYEEGNR